MKDQRCSIYKIISLLLHYPERRLLKDLGEIRETVLEIFDQHVKEACLEFLVHVDKTSLIRLQEDYTTTFDLNPPTSLNITYHKFAESRERGLALARFNQMYEEDGYERTTTELPDYLPMVLEFASVCAPERGVGILSEYSNEIARLSSRLATQGSPYAGLLGIIASMSRELMR